MLKQMNNFFYWLLPFGWMSSIFYASSQPYEEQDLKPLLSSSLDLSFLRPYLDWISFQYHYSEVSIHTLGTEGFIEFFIRKGAHVGAFMVLFLLLYLALKKTTSMNFRALFVFSFFITCVYAILDEFHQSITPNRTPYAGDVLLDCFGALLGVLLIWFIHFFRLRKG